MAPASVPDERRDPDRDRDRANGALRHRQLGENPTCGAGALRRWQWRLHFSTVTLVCNTGHLKTINDLI